MTRILSLPPFPSPRRTAKNEKVADNMRGKFPCPDEQEKSTRCCGNAENLFQFLRVQVLPSCIQMHHGMCRGALDWMGILTSLARCVAPGHDRVQPSPFLPNCKLVDHLLSGFVLHSIGTLRNRMMPENVLIGLATTEWYRKRQEGQRWWGSFARTQAVYRSFET